VVLSGVNKGYLQLVHILVHCLPRTMAMPAYQIAYDPLVINSPFSSRQMNGHTDTNGGSLGGKFPHTRAQLSAIARQYKPTDNYDGDVEADDYNKVPQNLVNEVVSLLVDEKEDDLKTLLKSSYAMDDESVCVSTLPDLRDRLPGCGTNFCGCRLSRMCWI